MEDRAKVLATGGSIRQYDGYLGRPIWEEPDNASTLYDRKLDSQCVVPSKSITELRKELGMAVSQQ